MKMLQFDNSGNGTFWPLFHSSKYTVKKYLYTNRSKLSRKGYETNLDTPFGLNLAYVIKHLPNVG